LSVSERVSGSAACSIAVGVARMPRCLWDVATDTDDCSKGRIDFGCNPTPKGNVAVLPSRPKVTSTDLKDGKCRGS
jgi:hypothetical protein